MHIELIARLRGTLENDNPDYGVYAGEQLVGRIFRLHERRPDVPSAGV